jgi:hypothetical protein
VFCAGSELGIDCGTMGILRTVECVRGIVGIVSCGDVEVRW